MDLLLTSAGIRNPSIEAALVDLLGKPIEESTALFVPAGIYPFPGGAFNAVEAMRGGRNRLCDLNWKSLGLLELSALPTIKRDSLGWQCALPLLLDEKVRAGRPFLRTQQPCLRRRERRKHRHDPV